MSKNEIHARLSPDLMEEVRKLTHNQKFPTISHAVRWLIDSGFKAINNEIELQKKKNSIVQIIEQELGVSFAKCRDEYDPEDGQVYWFWFEGKNKDSEQFDADSSSNWCPTNRFKSQEDAVKDCLKQKFNESSIDSVKQSFSPSLDLPNNTDEDRIIDW